MIKSIFHIVLIAAIAYFATLVWPWWLIGVSAFFVSAVFPCSSKRAFFQSFIAIFLLWGGLAFMINEQTDAVLGAKVAAIFGLQDPILLVLITALIGGFVAALAGLSGSLFRAMFQSKRRRRAYY